MSAAVVLQPEMTEDRKKIEAFAELERGVYAALETYSNVHRGSGHNSLVTTYLYDRAREIVLDYLGLEKNKFVVIFTTPRRAEILKTQLKSNLHHSLSSEEIGLPLGLRACVVEKNGLPGGMPFEAGGGTARLVGQGWVIWSKGVDKFEAGTPPIVNVIAFARALQLAHQSGAEIFQGAENERCTASEILYRDELEQFTGRALLDELRRTLIGQRTPVPTAQGTRPFINLDNAASTPTFSPIWEAARQTWRQSRQVQKEIVEEVKSICAQFLGAPLDEYDVIFTSNTTEAINLAADNINLEAKDGVQPVVANTLLEHNSNELPWRQVSGSALLHLQIDAEGFVDMNELESLLSDYNARCAHGRERIRLVAVSGASNVLGVFNDLAEIGRIVHRHGARLLVDGAQLVAHRKVDLEKAGIDYFAFSAHKVYAPFGTGVLIARKGLLKFDDAELERIKASGEENVMGIAALGKALVLLQRIGLDLVQEEEQALTAQTLKGLSQIPGLKLYGIKDPTSPLFAQKGAVIPFILEDRLATDVAKELAEQGGIGIRAGCHCAHLLVKRMLEIPPWQARLQRMIVTLFPKLSLPGVARVSLGIENSSEDIKVLIHVLDRIARRPKSSADNPFTPRQTPAQKQMEQFARTAAQRVYL